MGKVVKYCIVCQRTEDILQNILMNSTGFTADDLRRKTSASYRLGCCYVLVNCVYSPHVKKRH